METEVIPAGGRHGAEQFREIADNGTILRIITGSALHGTAVGDQGDRDEQGICVEPITWLAGVRSFPDPTPLSPGGPFEQYIYRTKAEGVPSGPGDLDLTVYGLRKWMRLALDGNPSSLLPLFVPDFAVVAETVLGKELRALAPAILSRRAGGRFAGYLDRQRQSMLSREGKGRDVTRPELVAKYGFDCKYGAHMIRLGFQGRELMTTGRITLPMPEAEREYVREIRQGHVSMRECLHNAELLEKQIGEAAQTSPLPEQPGYARVDRWMNGAYLRMWLGDAR